MPRKTLDRTDLRILHELQANGRLTNVELAARIGLSPSPCLTRVRQLERDGVLRGYVALADPEALGLSMTVFVQVTLERQVEQALRNFESKMDAIPEVMECYLMTGDSDYLVRLVVPDLAALERFILRELSTVPGVANINSSLALKQVKYNTALPTG